MSANEPEARKMQEQFTTFKMPNGDLHKIRNKYLLTYAVEVLENVPPLSKGAEILKYAIASSNGLGRICELLAMLED